MILSSRSTASIMRLSRAAHIGQTERAKGPHPLRRRARALPVADAARPPGASARGRRRGARRTRCAADAVRGGRARQVHAAQRQRQRPPTCKAWRIRRRRWDLPRSSRQRCIPWRIRGERPSFPRTDRGGQTAQAGADRLSPPLLRRDSCLTNEPLLERHEGRLVACHFPLEAEPREARPLEGEPREARLVQVAVGQPSS